MLALLRQAPHPIITTQHARVLSILCQLQQMEKWAEICNLWRRRRLRPHGLKLLPAMIPDV